MARRLHAQVYEKLSKDIDPAAEVVRTRQEYRRALTVEALSNEYLEVWAKRRKHSWAEDARILRADVLPMLGKLKALDVTRRDVINCLDTILSRGAPISANRTLAFVRKLFNFAIDRDILNTSPCVRIPAPSKENRRSRILNEAEIKVFWCGLGSSMISEPMCLALKLILLTSQRPGEIIGAQWREINGDWWIIPPERTKNALVHRVPLSAQTLGVLDQVRVLSANSQWLFPSPQKDQSITRQHLSGVVLRERENFGIEDFTPHDLRRTTASHLTSLGISRLTVSKLLNHAESGVTAVYDRYSYDGEKRRALDMWGY